MARPLASESLERTPRPVRVDFFSPEEEDGEEEEEEEAPPGFQPFLEMFFRESIFFFSSFLYVERREGGVVCFV